MSDKPGCEAFNQIGVNEVTKEAAYLPVLMRAQQRRHGCHDPVMGLKR